MGYKKVLNNKNHLIMVIAGLIALVSAIFFANYIYYINIDASLVGSGIWQNMLAIICNLLIGFMIAKEFVFWSADERAWIFLPILPICIVILTFWVRIYGVSVDGQTEWIQIGFFTFNYFVILVYLLFFMVPAGIDGLLKKQFKYEEVGVSIVILISMGMLAVGIQDLQGTLWCGVFLTGYYLYRRKKILLMPIVATAIPILYAVFECCTKPFEEESLTPNAYKYVYAYPLVSLKDAFSIFTVIFVLVIYVVLAILLWNYVQRYVIEEYKPRGFFFFWGMMFFWIISIINDLGFLNNDFYGNVPFSTNSGLIWLVPIVSIIMMTEPNMEKNDGEKI